MNNVAKAVLCIIALLLLMAWALSIFIPVPSRVQPLPPDTLRPPVYVPPAPIDTPRRETPRKVVLPVKKEPEIRRAVEHGSQIVINVELDPIAGVQVTTVDTSGQLMVKTFELPEDFKSVRIDSTGQVEVRRLKWTGRAWRRIKRNWKAVAIGAGAGIVGATLIRR